MVVACLAFLVAKMTQRQDLTASVESVHWMRTIPILAMVEVQRQAFSDEIPADADVGQCETKVEQSLAMCTALAPVIGYDKAATIAKTAYETGRTVREIARETSRLDPKELDRLLNPRRQTEPGA